MVDAFIKNQLVEAIKLFWEKGLSPGEDSGDLSIRDSRTNYIYICPRPNESLKIPNWGVIREKDIVVLDLEGNIIGDSCVQPTVEAPMHLLLYKARPEINAIIHSHAVWSSAFAITGQNIPLSLAEQSIFLGGEIVCARYGRIGSLYLAENIVEALGNNKMAALMRNHGAVVLGQDIGQAFRLSDFLEKSAKTVIMGSILGKVLSIDTEDIVDDSIKDFI